MIIFLGFFLQPFLLGQFFLIRLVSPCGSFFTMSGPFSHLSQPIPRLGSQRMNLCLSRPTSLFSNCLFSQKGQPPLITPSLYNC